MNSLDGIGIIYVVPSIWNKRAWLCSVEYTKLITLSSLTVARCGEAPSALYIAFK
jgi:hypothetical protein